MNKLLKSRIYVNLIDGLVSIGVLVVVVVGLDLLIVTYSGVDKRLNGLCVVINPSFFARSSSSSRVVSVTPPSESGLLVVDLLKNSY